MNVSGKPTIIILNGPPWSGKDTIAGLLAKHGKYYIESFKIPMHAMAIAMTGWSEFEWHSKYNNRSLKEVPQDELGGKTFREFMIHISEDMMKPLFGKAVFGDLMATRIRREWAYGTGGVVVSDGGFPDEVYPLLSVGDVHVVRLHRDGFTFAGDRRRYLAEEDFVGLPVQFMDIQLSEGKPEQAAYHILDGVI